MRSFTSLHPSYLKVYNNADLLYCRCDNNESPPCFFSLFKKCRTNWFYHKQPLHICSVTLIAKAMRLTWPLGGQREMESSSITQSSVTQIWRAQHNDEWALPVGQIRPTLQSGEGQSAMVFHSSTEPQEASFQMFARQHQLHNKLKVTSNTAACL